MVDVRLQVVDAGLLVVAEIAYAEGEAAAHLTVEGQLLTEGGGRDEGGGHQVVVVVAAREDFVVGLPVVRTEHQTDEGQL